MIWRLRSTPALKDYGIALLVTVLALPALAWAAMWLFPAGCDVRGGPALFRWTCLFPGLMLTVPVVMAVAVPVVMIVNRRSRKTLPDGLLPVALVAGLVTQIILIGGYFIALDPAYSRIFLTETLSIPQPFVAGALSAGMFWAVIALRQPR